MTTKIKKALKAKYPTKAELTRMAILDGLNTRDIIESEIYAFTQYSTEHPETAKVIDAMIWTLIDIRKANDETLNDLKKLVEK